MRILAAIVCAASLRGATPGDRDVQANEVYPPALLIQNGGRIYNVQTPPDGRPAAAGNGTADDSDALISAIDYIAEKNRADGVGTAIGEWKKSWTIYLPNGTYLVTRSLHYTGALVKDFVTQGDPHRGGFQGLQIVGQSREGTIIKLKDGCDGFGADANVPVLSWSRFDLGETFNNWPGKHKLANLTIDIGTGNPGAIGVDFYGANSSRINNLKIVGGGPVGLHFRAATIAGYHSNIVVDGFARGIALEAQVESNIQVTDGILEYVTLRNQTQAGLFLRSTVTSSIRSLDYEGAGPAIMIENHGTGRPHLVLIDSALNAKPANSGPAISITNGFLFARGVTVTGFDSSVRQDGRPVARGNVVEYVSDPIATFDPTRVRKAGPKSMNLPIEDWPVMRWEPDFTKWAVVDDFPGANDTEKIQAAMNSGRPVIAFKKLSYTVGGAPITVPASVRQILGLGTHLRGRGVLFNFTGDTADPVFIHNFSADGQQVTHTSSRTAIYDFVRSMNLSANTNPNLKVFFNAGGALGAGTFTGLKLYARWMNSEGSQDFIFNFGQGTVAWIFGHKSEKTYSRWRASDDAFLEVLGGTLSRHNVHPGADRVCILNDHANVSFVCSTKGPDRNWAPMVEDRQATTRTWAMSDFTDRGDKGNIVVPLYASYDPAVVPQGANAIVAAARDPLPISGEFTARPADAFVDSVGVCMHLGRVSTIYVQRFPEIARLLLESGIRHIRTDPVTAPEAVANVRQLGAQGVKFDFIMRPEGDESFVGRFLANIRTNFADCTAYLEGPNEPDRRPEWARQWMQNLYRQAKADPVLKAVPVLGSALAHPDRASSAFGDCTSFVDLGNVHAYPGGRKPEGAFLVRRIADVQPQYPNVKYVFTETGYHSALDNLPGGHQPTSREAEAIYMPRLHLEYFRTGIIRSYKYQFIDEQTDDDARRRKQPVAEANFGYVDHEMRPKPSYYAVKNLLTILSDPTRESFEPKSLSYAIEGPKDEMRHLLLQKSNGDFYLAVWRAVTVWDEVARKEVPVESVPVTVRLDKPVNTVRVYQPTRSAEPIETRRNVDRLGLELDGEAVLLEINVRARKN